MNENNLTVTINIEFEDYVTKEMSKNFKRKLIEFIDFQPKIASSTFEFIKGGTNHE